MRLIVCSNGTFVNNETTSKLTNMSDGLKKNSFNFVRKLDVLFNMNSDGMCGFIILSKYFARLYSAVLIIETMGQKGNPALCALHKPYNLPGWLPDGYIALKSDSLIFSFTCLRK